MAQLDHRFDDDFVVPSSADPADERAADLDRLHGQLTQVGERGEAAAEIVDRQADAKIGHAPEAGDRGFAADVDEGVLGELELEAVGRQRGLLDDLLQQGRKLRLIDLCGRDIDRDFGR